MTERVTVTGKMMREALDSLGIEKNSIILTHSSLKALGNIEGGAMGVINALSDTVPEGTLVFPTLSQKNWSTVFEDWHLDRPSDVGLISETFRKLDGAVRSDNPTHSVSAKGPLAEDIAAHHNEGKERWGLFGEYCFCENSPWQRMYESRSRYGVKAYVIFWGVTMMYNTLKHFSEYRFVERLLSSIQNEEKREEIRSYLYHYPVPRGTTEETMRWPFYSSEKFQEVLLNEGIAKRIPLGEGELIVCDIYDSVTRVDKALWEEPEAMLKPHMYEWVLRARAAME